MMFKKSWLSLGLAFILCLSLFAVGCGGGGGGKKGNKNGETFALAESLVPGAPSFPTGTDDSGECLTVNYSYYMAKYEVTYNLWKKVYDWANSNGYTFCNPGNPGGGWDDTNKVDIYFDTGHETHPVTNINRYDVYAWCNALTEYYNTKNGKNLDCVYKDKDGNIIKDATNGDIQEYIESMNDFDRSAKGFRLPTSMEWELAARYIDGSNWTPGNYASGATADCTDSEAIGAVAWYWDNSKISSAPDIYSTQQVGQKKPNALGIYDMTGNVGELCFGTPKDFFSFRIYRGGCFDDDSYLNLQLGYENGSAPDYASPNIGFRTVRTE
jgi:sulfatase modifying factor 1